MRPRVLVVWLAACSGDPECSTGFEPGADGSCYEVAEERDDPVETADTAGEPPPDPEDALDLVLDTLPECEPLADDGAIDLRGPTYCAGPGCVDMTFTELADAYGTAACALDDDTVECWWPEWDVFAYFDDGDGDGEAAPDQQAYGFYVGPYFPGATDAGLGAGMSIRCFVDEHGMPTDLEIAEMYGESWILWWGWDGGAWYVLDAYDGESPGADGYGEYLWLNGPG